MASRRMLIDTAVLMNYVGEVDDVATYQETTLLHCYCPVNEGADLNMQGKKANDSGRLYIFDEKTVALSEDGTARSFMAYDQWKSLDDKSQHWTISDKGTDYFKKVGSSLKLRITGFAHKKAGSRRMWHYEVDGR